MNQSINDLPSIFLALIGFEFVLVCSPVWVLDVSWVIMGAGAGIPDRDVNPLNTLDYCPIGFEFRNGICRNWVGGLSRSPRDYTFESLKV